MQHAEPTDHLTALLSELERLLEGECRALKRLDRPAIDECATHKLALFERLSSELVRVRPSAAHHAQLERVHKSALLNQLLLVHARDAVRGTLALLTGETTGSQRPSFSATPAGGMRIDVRG